MGLNPVSMNEDYYVVRSGFDTEVEARADLAVFLTSPRASDFMNRDSYVYETGNGKWMWTFEGWSGEEDFTIGW